MNNYYYCLNVPRRKMGRMERDILCGQKKSAGGENLNSRGSQFEKEGWMSMEVVQKMLLLMNSKSKLY